MTENTGMLRPAKVPKLPYRNRLSLSNRALRLSWGVVYSVLFRPTPKPLHGWRRFLLRLFGATVAATARPCPRCRIFAPWNLYMGEYSCLADDVDCYCVAPIRLGAHATVSQHAHLCAATHDYGVPEFPLTPLPIVIGDYAWVAAGAFVGPGVTVEEGAVVGARACVVRDVPAWTVVAGNPARFVKRRTVSDTTPAGGSAESPVP
jgi:putative colanic acid biosynthesis acetyltransferase WcaF